MRESKEVRAERQAVELWRFVNVLRMAGNRVEEEVRFDTREADPTQSPSIPRKWRIDLAIRQCHFGTYSHPIIADLAIELEGYGRHQSMVGFTADLEKYAEAFAQGWVVLRVSRKMITDGTALDVLARAGVKVEP